MLSLGSKIEKVTVYRAGATVTRVAYLQRPAEGWPDRLRLVGLPLTLKDSSLRASVAYPEGGGGLLATDLQVDLDWEAPAVEPPPVVDEEAVGKLRRHLRSLTLQLELLNKQLGWLESLHAAHPSSPEPRNYPLKARRSLIALRQRKLVDGYRRREQLQGEILEVQKQLPESQPRKDAGPQETAPIFKAALLHLRSLPDSHCTKLALRLSYEVEGARWAPGYSLRFDRDFTMVSLEMQVLICQSSGEAWEGVQLEVSTSDISSWKELPELTSRHIGRSQLPPPKPGYRPPPPNTHLLFGDFDRGPSPLRAEPVHTKSYPAQPPKPKPVAAAEPVGAANESLFKDEGTELESSYDPFAAPPPDPFAAADPFGAADPFAASSDPFACADPFAAPADPFGAPREEVPGRSAMRRSAAPGDAPRNLVDRIAGLSRKAQAEGGGKPSLSRAPMVQSVAVSAPAPGLPLSPIPPRPQRPGAGLNPSYRAEPDYQSLSSEQLAYGLLYMPAASEPGRGSLKVQQPLEVCLQLWRQRYPDSPVQPRPLIEAALRSGKQALYQTAPGGHHLVGSIEGFDYLYPGECPIDLPSDAQFHAVPLLQRQLEAQMTWITVPRVVNDVFRQARVESLPDLALPPGPADIYVGNDYLATTHLAAVNPGQSFSVGLGVEQSIKVIRNTSFKETTSGMMGGTLLLHHEIVVEAANRLGRQARLEVRESLPVPADDQGEVKVRVEACDPPWEPMADQKSVYRWSLPIPAGESRKAQVSYVVEIPSKSELVGGNRREA